MIKKGDKILVCDSIEDTVYGNFVERTFVVFHQGKSYCEEENRTVLVGWEYAKEIGK